MQKTMKISKTFGIFQPKQSQPQILMKILASSQQWRLKTTHFLQQYSILKRVFLNGEFQRIDLSILFKPPRNS